MSYSTPQKVKDMFRNFTANATNKAVTDDTLQEWLDEAAIEINARVMYYYSMPIVALGSPQAWLVLGKIERLMVACQVDDTLNSYAEKQKKPQYCKRAAEMLQEYAPINDKGKCGICEPIARLPDADYIGPQNTGRRLSASVTDVAPTFEKGVDKW